MGRHILIVGSCAALLGVAAGAFGAHGLRSVLSEHMITVFETGVRYHLIHAMAMLIAGLGAQVFQVRSLMMAGWSFFAGILIFSGSLYVLALTDISALGILTPFGGLAFLGGWGLLAKGFWALSSFHKS